jgi:hypothetical protein
MLAYFPEVYPDELFYSIVARWLRHVGCAQRTVALEALFGRRFVPTSLYVPGGLPDLARHAPDRPDLEVDRLIENHTLFRYGTAFSSSGVRARALEAMRAGDVRGCYVRLGLATFCIGPVAALRFCRDCLDEMQAQHGEWYWRRIHNLPGVYLCAIHGRVLQLSDVVPSLRGRHEFVPATRRTCSSASPLAVEGSSANARSKLLALAEATQNTLENPPPARPLSSWAEQYRSQLLSLGWAWSVRRVKQTELSAAFTTYWAPMRALLPELSDGARWRGDWLAKLVRRPRTAAHPLQHLMLQQFLSAFAPSTPSFGSGPWPCFNPLADHQGHLTISAVRIGRNHGHRFGEFSCDCGYVYTRRLDADGSVGLPRIRQYGSLLLPALRSLVADRVGLHAIARRLRLDPTTVVRLAQREGLAVDWAPRPRKRTASRGAGATPPMPRIVGTPDSPRSMPHGHASRRDWDQVDDQERARVEGAVRSLLAMMPPVRVTYAGIERLLGRREWLTRRQRKLPRTAALLRESVETTAAFESRRIEWAVQQWVRGRPPRAWEVMRLAGVRSHALPRIRALLTPTFFPGR